MSKKNDTAEKQEEQVMEEQVDQETAEDQNQDQEENLEDPEEETPDLEIELAEAKDKYLRLYSEFENFRRRTAKERIELIGTASKEVIEALVPVLDDFERAIKAADDAGEENEGVSLIYNKFKGILEGKGLKKMEIKAGDAFDDEFHEAISQIPAPEKKLAGKIVDVIEPGYFLGDKVLRFAKVVTGAKKLI